VAHPVRAAQGCNRRPGGLLSAGEEEAIRKLTEEEITEAYHFHMKHIEMLLKEMRRRVEEAKENERDAR
jgi:hypothetical protein